MSWQGHFLYQEEAQLQEVVGSFVVHLTPRESSPPRQKRTNHSNKSSQEIQVSAHMSRSRNDPHESVTLQSTEPPLANYSVLSLRVRCRSTHLPPERGASKSSKLHPWSSQHALLLTVPSPPQARMRRFGTFLYNSSLTDREKQQRSVLLMHLQALSMLINRILYLA